MGHTMMRAARPISDRTALSSMAVAPYSPRSGKLPNVSSQGTLQIPGWLLSSPVATRRDRSVRNSSPTYEERLDKMAVADGCSVRGASQPSANANFGPDPVVTWDELERLELVREGAFWQLPDGSVLSAPWKVRGFRKRAWPWLRALPSPRTLRRRMVVNRWLKAFLASD